MKALSIRQPWPWAMLHAKHQKPVENRTWPPPPELLGQRILLHASKGCTREEYAKAADFIEWANVGQRPPPLAELPRGGIVGIATLYGFADHNGDGRMFDPNVAARIIHDSPWYVGPWGWFLTDRKPLPFTPLKGRLGFFDVPEELVRKLGVAA